MSDFNNKASLTMVIEPILTIDIIAFAMCLGGMMLNVLLLYLTLFRKERKAIDIALITIISFFDCLLCLTLIISLTFRWWLGWGVLANTSSWCLLNAIFYKASVLSTLLGTALLALVRYLALVRKWQLSNKFWITISLCLVCLVWIILTYLNASSQLLVLPSGLHCVAKLFDDNWETNIVGYLLLTILYPTSIVIPICYVLIIFHLRRQLSRKCTPFLQRRTLYLIITVLTYILCIFTDYIHILLTKLIRVRRTPLSDGITMTLTLSVTIVNALLALFLHDDINNDFRSLIKYSEPRPRPRSFYDF